MEFLRNIRNNIHWDDFIAGFLLAVWLLLAVIIVVRYK